MENKETTTPWTVALAICFVLEMLLWWKLNWNPWAVTLMFVCGCRGSFMVRRNQIKELEEL